MRIGKKSKGEASETDGHPADQRSPGVTVRLPLPIIIGFGVALVAAAAAAAFLIVREPAKDCIAPDTGAMVACGGEGVMSQSEYNEFKSQEAAAEAELAEAKSEMAKCTRQLGGLMEALQELDSRLAVGLNFENYGRQLGNARVAYDRVPFGGLSLDCLSIGADLESALNRYAKAGGAWGDCIQDLGCDMDQVDPELQAQWSSAGSKVENAEVGIRRLGRPASPGTVDAFLE